MSKTKYEQLADILMDKLEEKELHANVLVGSTFGVKWDEIVTPDYGCWGVLNPSGGSNIELNNGALIQSENITLAIAIPNDDYKTYSMALDKFSIAISDIVKEYQEIDNTYYQVVDNGRTGTAFLTIKGGREIAIITQSLNIAGGDDLLNVKDVTITIKEVDTSGTIGEAQTFSGFFNYIFQKQKNFDSVIKKNTPTQQNMVQSLQKTLTIDYYKFKNNNLHRALESDTSTFKITLNDGDTILLNDVEMHLSGLTQNGVIGNYLTMRVSFIDGVV